MTGYLVVFVGAGVGGSIRHFMNIWVAHLLGTHFPYHTFVINILGSLVMGLVAGWFIHRGDPEGHMRLFLATGILGGFTTFSAFSNFALPANSVMIGRVSGSHVASGVPALTVWSLLMLSVAP